MTMAMTGLGEPGAAPRAAATYALAQRHSRLVRFLRKAIPIATVVSFLAFVLFPIFNPFRGGGIVVGGVKMDGTRVTMENPRLAGHRKDNKPYEVTAQSALQDIRRPNVIEMIQMNARLVNSNDGVILLTARNAVFDSTKEQMTLREDVRVRTENGQEAFLKSADVDFKAGTVRSREPVRVRFPDMGVTADGLDVADSGAKIAFIGRVSALIDDKDSKAAAAAPAPGGAAAQPGANAQPRPSPAAQQPQASVPQGPPPRDARGPTVIDPATGRAVPTGATR